MQHTSSLHLLHRGWDSGIYRGIYYTLICQETKNGFIYVVLLLLLLLGLNLVDYNTLMEQMLAHFTSRVNNLSFWSNRDCQVCVNKMVDFVIGTTDFVYFGPVVFLLGFICYPQNAVFQNYRRPMIYTLLIYSF